MLVEDIMSKKLVTADINETVKEACNRYRELKVGCLVITDKDQIAGLVTERDIIERTICNDRDPNTTKISEIMSIDIKTVDSYASIEEALEIMQKNKIKKIPVVSNNELVGIITITDIAYTRPSIKKFLQLKDATVPENKYL